jgi:hypothetical protein
MVATGMHAAQGAMTGRHFGRAGPPQNCVAIKPGFVPNEGTKTGHEALHMRGTSMNRIIVAPGAL